MADDAAPLVPELARSLRTLRQPASAATDAAHTAVFGPLLDARARAAREDEAGAIAALRGAALAARIESLARAAATEGEPDAARARARVAAAREALEPLRAAFDALDAAAIPAGRAGSASPDWQRWVDQLRRVFAAADAACDELAAVLAQREPPASAGWFGRGTGGGRA